MHHDFEYYSSLFDNDFCAIFGETFIVTGSILLLLYGVVYSKYESRNVPKRQLSEFGFDFSCLPASQKFTLCSYADQQRYARAPVLSLPKDKKDDTNYFDSSSLSPFALLQEGASNASQKMGLEQLLKKINAYSASLAKGEKETVTQVKQGTDSIRKDDSYFESNTNADTDTCTDIHEPLQEKSTHTFLPPEDEEVQETQVDSTQQSSNIPILLTNCGAHTLLILFFATLLLKDNPIDGDLFYNCLVIDFFTRFIQISVCVGAFLSVLISLQYTERINTFEVLVLILLASASMAFLASASDLISVYLAIELQSLSFYVLAGLKRNSEFSTEAGLKYFLLGAFSSGILLFGCSLLYCFTGITGFSEYSHLFASCIEIENTNLEQSDTIINNFLPLRALQLGFAFVLISVLFKCSAAPFHMWAPDVYEGAPTSITAFFSIVPKLSVFALLVRLVYTAFHQLIDQTPLQTLLIFSCIASLFVGTFSAIAQNKIKRLLAYSSIGHVGYILMACTIHSQDSLVALLVYLLIYIVMTVAIFGVVLSPLVREPYSQQSFVTKAN
jgi:proton-translocating NADH-quinone oxidoreductase chain N